MKKKRSGKGKLGSARDSVEQPAMFQADSEEYLLEEGSVESGSAYKKRPAFKAYAQSQRMLFPPSYEEMVPENHPVRVVSSVIDRISLENLYGAYHGGGASSYDPRMLLKVIVYAYVRNIYSSRKIEEALRENVHFMWLSGGTVADHNTIARFRSSRLKDGIKEVFVEVVKLLHAEGYVDLKSIVTDGTKFEANANRHKIVWAKRVKRYRESIEKQIREVAEYAARGDGDDDPNLPDFEDIDAEKLEKVVEDLNTRLKGKDVPREVKGKFERVRAKGPERLRRYEEQERILDGRTSYSATDKDATAMRQKDDHMRTAPLKPSYNVQFSTEGHMVTNYTVGQEHTDTTALIPHMDDWRKCYGSMPESVTADAGYGSEANYQYMEDNGIEAFVKHNFFDKENKGWEPDRFTAAAFGCDAETGTVICPIGKPMVLIGTRTEKTEGGHEKTLHRYRAEGCRECPLRDSCITRGDRRRNRVIEISLNSRRLRKKAGELLETDVGIGKRKERYKVEAVIGNLKHNKNFRRFLLRGIEKVAAEIGILSIANNLSRLATLQTA